MRTREGRVARAFRRTALPLCSYYAITLVVPVANGAVLSGAFVRHALVVLVAPPAAILVACALSASAQTLARFVRTKAMER
jgi:hypothetical protein